LRGGSIEIRFDRPDHGRPGEILEVSVSRSNQRAGNQEQKGRLPPAGLYDSAAIAGDKHRSKIRCGSTGRMRENGHRLEAQAGRVAVASENEMMRTPLLLHLWDK